MSKSFPVATATDHEAWQQQVFENIMDQLTGLDVGTAYNLSMNMLARVILAGASSLEDAYEECDECADGLKKAIEQNKHFLGEERRKRDKDLLQ